MYYVKLVWYFIIWHTIWRIPAYVRWHRRMDAAKFNRAFKTANEKQSNIK